MIIIFNLFNTDSKNNKNIYMYINKQFFLSFFLKKKNNTT
jgi:hypothetical protein